MTESEKRQAVVDEVYTWIGTPWHHMARYKGGKGCGVDCAQLLCAVYEAAGLIPHIDLGFYPPQWHLHQDRPRFLEILSQYANPLDRALEPLPGDVAMFQWGRHAAHGSIVVRWPLIVHAFRGECVIEADASKDPLAARLAGIWRLHAMVND